MAGIQGALIVTSAFQMIIGFFGLWRNVVRILSPLSAVPFVTFTSLGLYHLAFPMLAKCIAIGLPELVIMHDCNLTVSSSVYKIEKTYM